MGTARIDHVLYAAPELEAAVADLAARLGVRAAGGGQHPGVGTHNRLLGLGPHTYLEVIAPDPSQPGPALPRPYGVDGVTSGRVVGWALTVDDIDAAVARARAAGFDPGEVLDGQRRTPDGELLRWRLTANARTAGVVPFLIDWGGTPHPARSAPAGLALASLHIEHPEPANVLAALRALGVEVEVRAASTEALVMRVDGPNGMVEVR
ncbi:VOC family protein [Saccharothrix sp. NPDC042600]|uniref:VOC family protein n=1 Tax=Saccharothrix TaxID=2071 RepID=UPI0033DA9813